MNILALICITLCSMWVLHLINALKLFPSRTIVLVSMLVTSLIIWAFYVFLGPPVSLVGLL